MVTQTGDLFGKDCSSVNLIVYMIVQGYLGEKKVLSNTDTFLLSAVAFDCDHQLTVHLQRGVTPVKSKLPVAR